MSLPLTLDRITSSLDASVSRLFELVRIPSISTDPAFAAEVQRACEWAVAELRSIGFDATIRPTDGHPVVVAHWTGPVEREAPHVLFYGHLDVQPVDPVELWDKPPFEPHFVARADGTKIMVARGVSDDKGQLMTFVEACRALVNQTGSLPVRVSLLLEGEEECGSPSLGAFFEANKAELSKDLALVCDTNMWDRETPAITATLRGLVAEEVVVHCANRDLHSGNFGGAALNPLRVLTKILGQLQDDNGACTLPGFYDGVVAPPKSITDAWQAIGLTPQEFLGPVGLSTLAGEEGYSVLEQTWTRPTCDINGLSGGYAGDGFKTVLPGKAVAKVSFRLVAGQDPERIQASFRAFVEQSLPADARVEFKSCSLSPALQVAYDHPSLQKAAAALTSEWDKAALLVGSGGSIPVVGLFKEKLGMDSILIGFSLVDDQIHSPNEKYELTSFHKGIRSWARVLYSL